MHMIDTQYLRMIRGHLLDYADTRKAVISRSDEALHVSKRAIFALHRADTLLAKEKLVAAYAIFADIQKKYPKNFLVFQEGSYKAALEEFIEATLLFAFIEKKKLSRIAKLVVEDTVYIAGLCDVPGELYRYAVQAATNHDTKEVIRCAAVAQAIVAELIECNLTSYLRNKFDQAKRAVEKIEYLVYQQSLQKN